jgi:F-type H+-transporting ATPase subunit b
MHAVEKLVKLTLLTVAIFLASFALSFLGASVALAQPAETPSAYDPANPPTHMPPSDEPPPAVTDKPASTDATAHDAEHGGHGGHHDPSHDFNFFRFDYRGKDLKGGAYGDGKMVDPHSGQETSGEEPMSPPFIFMILNFVLFLAILAKFGGPAARKLAAERHDQIKTALDEAARLRGLAADKLADYEKRLGAADAEIKAMVAGMRADAEADKQRILAAAEQQAAQMKRDAELRIAAEIELARIALTREVTAAASAATEQLLRDRMTPADDQKLVGSFIEGVKNAPAPGRPERSR